MNFSYGPEAGQKRAGRSSSKNNDIVRENISSSSEKSDRLQKAIARNRAKQAKRAGNSSESESPQFKRRESKTLEASPSEIAATRKSVATVNNVEFTESIKKTASKATSRPVVYSNAKRKVRTRPRKTKNSVFIEYLVKFGWAFCLFLCFRLIFSDGGVLDYYSSLDLLSAKTQEHEMIVKENEELLKTIKKIKTNPRFQRKLVRDHLGFISQNEYLILFPKGKKGRFSN